LNSTYYNNEFPSSAHTISSSSSSSSSQLSRPQTVSTTSNHPHHNNDHHYLSTSSLSFPPLIYVPNQPVKREIKPQSVIEAEERKSVFIFICYFFGE